MGMITGTGIRDLGEGQRRMDLERTDLQAINERLEKSSAEERVAFALERYRPGIVLSSSFGAQAAVCLHLVTRQWPEIPVVLLDTQYLFPETYRFVDEMTERLRLNLRVYKSPLSAAWQEARWGKLWEQGMEGITRYNQMNKVEPMQRALRELDARAWIAGLRRQQSSTRRHLDVLAEQDGRIKVHPIIDWTDRDVYQYLKKHDLPYHPLWEQGYVSIGDVHTTRPLSEGMTEEETRFFGLKRECGIHEQPEYHI
jgi:phosphoadenosine phosphosulfate reductase